MLKNKITPLERKILKQIRKIGPWGFRAAWGQMRMRRNGATFPAAQSGAQDDANAFEKLYKLVNKLPLD